MPISGIVAGQKIAPEKLDRARQLRQEMTPAERTLWQELRGKKLGPHFRRQQIIGGFIVDFYCHTAALVIELDGGAHEGREQKESDVRRDQVLSEMGLRVVRFQNEDISASLPRVVAEIRALLEG